jgi:hypothetical protein
MKLKFDVEGTIELEINSDTFTNEELYEGLSKHGNLLLCLEEIKYKFLDLNSLTNPNEDVCEVGIVEVLDTDLTYNLQNNENSIYII